MSAPDPHEQAPTIHESALRLPADHPWNRLPALGLGLAAVGLGASLALGLSSAEGRAQLWHSWLVSSLFVLSLALGSLFFVLVHHATQAGWGVVVRRLAENAMATLPFLALLFAPMLLGMGELFHWSHADAVAADPQLAHKSSYLNVPYFALRAACCFGAWSVLAVWFGRASRLQDRTGDPEITRRCRRASAPALLVFAITVTVAAIDWLMSLAPHWYSTIFGVYFFAGSAGSAFALLALAAIAARRAGLLAGVISREHLHDLGKLLFAFVAFWAYIGFSQFFLIWYSNLPEETTFFAQRLAGSWRTASLALALGHFVIPFFFLLPRTVKRRSTTLAVGAGWMLVMHLLDLHWLVMPNLHREGMAPGLLDATALIGSLGVFFAAFGWSLRRQALVPLRDPRLQESLLFENP
jgi:hypothetical protein